MNDASFIPTAILWILVIAVIIFVVVTVARAIRIIPQATAGLGALDATGWAAVLFLGICCSGLGYLFWYRALERMEASRVGALLYLEPLVTLAAGALLLGEPIRPATVAGGLLLLAGVGMVQRAG